MKKRIVLTKEKTKMEQIREKEEYQSTGEMVFNSAISLVIDYGRENLINKDFVDILNKEVEVSISKSKSQGLTPIFGEDFQKAIVKCASEIAECSATEIRQYIQNN